MTGETDKLAVAAVSANDMDQHLASLEAVSEKLSEGGKDLVGIEAIAEQLTQVCPDTAVHGDVYNRIQTAKQPYEELARKLGTLETIFRYSA